MFLIILFEHYLPGVQMVLLSAFVIISLVNSGAILDQRRWIFYLECTRIFIVMAPIAVFYPNYWSWCGILIAAGLMTWFFRPIERYYLRILYSVNS